MLKRKITEQLNGAFVRYIIAVEMKVRGVLTDNVPNFNKAFREFQTISNDEGQVNGDKNEDEAGQNDLFPCLNVREILSNWSEQK